MRYALKQKNDVLHLDVRVSALTLTFPVACEGSVRGDVIKVNLPKKPLVNKKKKNLITYSPEINRNEITM